MTKECAKTSHELSSTMNDLTIYNRQTIPVVVQQEYQGTQWGVTWEDRWQHTPDLPLLFSSR